MRAYLTAVSAMALCVGLAACGDIPKPEYPVAPPAATAPAPVTQAAPAAAPAAAGDDPAAAAKPTTGVSSSALPPPPGAKVAPPRATKRGTAYEHGLGQPRLILAAYDPSDDVFPAAKTKAKRVAKAAAEEETVTVEKGQSLATVAKAHGTTIEALADANGLKSPYRVNAGQILKLPGAGASDEAPSVSAKGSHTAKDKAKPAAPETITVGKGDSLASIAKKSGVSINDLADINGLLRPYKIKPGQTLNLSAAASDAAPEPALAKGKKGSAAKAEAPSDSPVPTSTITVRRKDTIQTLAKQAKVSVAELARLNHLKKPYKVKPGQQIRLPDAPAGKAELEREISSSAPKRPTVVIAGRKDTLQSIAKKEGLRLDDLARLNGLKKPYKIKRGQKIKLPVRSEVPPETSSTQSYRVQAGDTLFSIARRFHTDTKTLADLNGLGPDEALKSGRRIRLPGGAQDQAPPRVSVRPSSPASDSEAAYPPLSSGRQPNQPAPYSSVSPNGPPQGVQQTPNPRIPPVVAPPPYRPPPVSAESTTPADADVAAAGKGLFIAPVRGVTLHPFGPIANGQRNDGLDIGAPSGTPVNAAAAGEVVYAGSSVPTFGNMVLIRHDGGWVTVYAHLANVDVKMRQTVTQGQSIGEVGTSGGVDQPQVHFEVRYNPSTKDKPRPIDPALVLP
jgi:murein DD-endopeptidase MepM/ murein hydrolase activator NlpD